MEQEKLEPKLKEIRWEFSHEKEIFARWNKEKIFSFDEDSKKKIFTIDTPPPYPSGKPWHVGAAAHYSQIDMIARTARLMGNEVNFPIGIDRNGLPVETYTEKKFNISIHQTPREVFIEHCKHALDDLEEYMIGIMKSMGMSGNFENYYRTDSEEYRKLTQTTFIELWKKGLIYEDTRPNNYCPVCRTTIADAEVLYSDLPTDLVHVNFEVKDGEFITIATTRPELMCSCQAIIVNPEDERYLHLKGQTAIVPVFNREVPIIAHPQADPKFGSGAVMICSYGDYADVRLFRELKLEEIIAIGEDGRMTKNARNYAGMKTKEARQKITEDLEQLGRVAKKEKITHRTPVCERSKNPIEIIPMKEFYLKQIEFVPEMKKLAKKLIFHPEEHRQILLNWIDSVSIDWPISRRRYYATEIPIWYCKDCGRPHLPEPGKYYQPWKQKAPFKKCEQCGSKEFVGETRTFDTWMDSSISALFVSGYKTNEKLFKKAFPTSIRTQAKEIVRTWLYYTLLRCFQLTGKIAFDHAWIMGYGVDEKGEKMSKSKGNVVDPLPVLEKFGADSFRFWNASEVSLGSDFRFSEEKIQGASKFVTKLWNVSRYISMFPEPKKVKLTKTDEWILAELAKLVKESEEGYVDYNFFVPSTKIRDFVWGTLAAHYMEMCKPRAYGTNFSDADKKAAWYTLHQCLKTVLQLLSPICPFVTDYIYNELYDDKNLQKKEFKDLDSEPDKKILNITEKIIGFNSEIWNIKKEKGISLREEIQIKIPKELKKFEKDLKAMHNIKS